MHWQVPLADVQITDSDLALVMDTLRSGWLTMGPRTAEFETAFAAYTDVRHAAAVSSGTAALHLICLGAGLGPGDEVILPSLTFVATANAVRYCGATPVFAEIAGITEPWLSPEAVEAAITPRTRAIMYVAFGGHPGSLREIAAIAQRHGIPVLLDAAHAVGTRLDDRQLGSWVHAAAHSFFSNKNLAVGEGGMVVTNDDALAERVGRLRSHGMTTLTWDRHRGHASDYDVVALGFNYRLDEPRAALGTARLERLAAEDERRAELAARYRAAFDGRLHCALPPADGARPAHHLFAVVLDDEAARPAFRRALADRGVQTSVHYPAIHEFAIYRDPPISLPLTEQYARRTVTLPLFAHLTHRDQDLVVDAALGALAGSPG
jgi:dTDP-4-amino-4,6-dideoxygalactose transaminase